MVASPLTSAHKKCTPPKENEWLLYFDGFGFSFNCFELLFENMIGACHQKNIMNSQRRKLKAMQHSSCKKKTKHK